jgi:uncharacterized membrane protein
MSAHAAVTILKPRDEVERMWNDPATRPDYIDGADAAVTFKEAPGDRGTELHVELERSTPGGKLGEAILKLGGREPVAKIKDDLRRFKQLVETGVIARSDASPEGELAERKLKQRPAQPLEDSEREKAGV